MDKKTIKKIQLIKIIFYNFILIFAFIGFVIISPPVLYKFSKFFSKNKIENIDERSKLDLYLNYKDWSDQFWREYQKISITYFDHVVFRHNDFEGQAINIKDGNRKTTTKYSKKNNNIEFWFFGGSTTWGIGVNDDNTYPVIFAKKSGNSVLNFGETGYVARQSLAYLINILLKKKNDLKKNTHIVFYDGINDVVYRCRSELKGLAGIREKQINKKLELTRSDDLFTYNETFSQFIKFKKRLINNISIKKKIKDVKKSYTCFDNPKRAIEVAEILVNTWSVASELAESRGYKFTAVLQPVAYLGSPKIDYLNLNKAEDLVIKNEFQIVYPLIRKLAKDKKINFLDLTDAYNNCDECYIDYDHVGPQGNKILVNFLSKHLLNGV
jgi:hypothetical protein